MVTQEDHYSTLGIPKCSSHDDVKKAFRQLALKYHPDKNPGSEEMFKTLNNAYNVLKDSTKRAVYDFDLRTQLPKNHFQKKHQEETTGKSGSQSKSGAASERKTEGTSHSNDKHRTEFNWRKNWTNKENDTSNNIPTNRHERPSKKKKENKRWDDQFYTYKSSPKASYGFTYEGMFDNNTNFFEFGSTLDDDFDVDDAHSPWTKPEVDNVCEYCGTTLEPELLLKHKSVCRRFSERYPQAYDKWRSGRNKANPPAEDMFDGKPKWRGPLDPDGGIFQDFPRDSSPVPNLNGYLDKSRSKNDVGYHGYKQYRDNKADSPRYQFAGFDSPAQKLLNKRRKEPTRLRPSARQRQSPVLSYSYDSASSSEKSPLHPDGDFYAERTENIFFSPPTNNGTYKLFNPDTTPFPKPGRNPTPKDWDWDKVKGGDWRNNLGEVCLKCGASFAKDTSRFCDLCGSKRTIFY